MQILSGFYIYKIYIANIWRFYFWQKSMRIMILHIMILLEIIILPFFIILIIFIISKIRVEFAKIRRVFFYLFFIFQRSPNTWGSHLRIIDIFLHNDKIFSSFELISKIWIRCNP